MVTGKKLGLMEQVWVYVFSLTVISAITAPSNDARRGIKAVVWTDVIPGQLIMFGLVGFAVWSLLGHIPGGWSGVKE